MRPSRRRRSDAIKPACLPAAMSKRVAASEWPVALLVTQPSTAGFLRRRSGLYQNPVQVRPADQEHLGMLGPLISAEVGDTVHVHFRNRLSFPASIHVHGLWYAKNAEGAPYADGTSGAAKPLPCLRP